MSLVALLAQGPIYATDPIDADPDPDSNFVAPTTVLVFGDLDRLDIKDLPPGYYEIIVIDGRGSQQAYVIEIR